MGEAGKLRLKCKKLCLREAGVYQTNLIIFSHRGWGGGQTHVKIMPSEMEVAPPRVLSGDGWDHTICYISKLLQEHRWIKRLP